jgi:hypothetical protein
MQKHEGKKAAGRSILEVVENKGANLQGRMQRRGVGIHTPAV